MKTIMLRLTLASGMLLVYSALNVFGQQTTLDQLIKDTRAAKIRTGQKVLKIKDKFPKTSTQYKTAEDLYDDVSAEAQAISETIANAIRQGKKPKGLDSFLRGLNAKSTKFVNYANQELNTQGSIGIPAVIMGVQQFWDLYTTNRDKKRAEKAKQFVQLMAFPNWDSITASSSK